MSRLLKCLALIVWWCFTATAQDFPFADNANPVTNGIATASVEVGAFGVGWIANEIGGMSFWELGQLGSITASSPTTGPATITITHWYDGMIFPIPLVSVGTNSAQYLSSSNVLNYAMGSWLESQWSFTATGEPIVIGVTDPMKDCAVHAISLHVQESPPRTTPQTVLPFTLTIWNNDPRWPGAILVRVNSADSSALYEVQSSPDLVHWSDEARMPAEEDWVMDLNPTRHARMFYRAQLLGGTTASQ